MSVESSQYLYPLGACQAGGSAIDWVMRDHGVGFRAACEIITAMVGGAPYPARPASVPTTGALLPFPNADQLAGQIIIQPSTGLAIISESGGGVGRTVAVFSSVRTER